MPQSMLNRVDWLKYAANQELIVESGNGPTVALLKAEQFLLVCKQELYLRAWFRKGEVKELIS